MALPFRNRNGIVIRSPAHQAMTTQLLGQSTQVKFYPGLGFAPVADSIPLSESSIDKGALAYAAIRAIEDLLADFNHQLADDSDDALHDVIWDQLGHITVKPA